MADEPNSEADPQNEPAEPTQEPEPEPAPSTEPQQLPADHPLVKTLGTLKAERNELRDKIKEFEDAQKTETERLADQKAEAEQAAAEARAEAARLRAAVKYGLEEEDLDLLGTGTDEEIEARAQRLSERLATTPDNGGVKRSPQEKLRTGATSSTEGTKSPEELADAVIKAQRGY